MVVKTTVIQPADVLKKYIRAYEYREFDTMGEEILKPVPASFETQVSLFINSSLYNYRNPDEDKPIYRHTPSVKPTSGIAGMQSSMKGAFVFKGHNRIFTIQFTPGGFSSIFAIPGTYIMNRLYDVREVLHTDMDLVHEQIHDAKSFYEMIPFVENYLLNKLVKNKTLYLNHPLLLATDALVTHPHQFSIKDLAYHTNMTLKTFERRFTEQVGLSPKLFHRVHRFSRAVELKMASPELSWADIAYRLGYYDQMHFIKDFKQFTNSTPSDFIKKTPPLAEDIRVME